MKTTPPIRIAASLAALCLAGHGAPIESRRVASPPCKRDSSSFMEQAIMLPIGSTTMAGDPAHTRLSKMAAAARAPLEPAAKAPPTVPADVRRIVYIAGGSEVLKPAFFTRLTKTFPQPRVVISLDPAYIVVQPSRNKPLRLIWKPKMDPFESVVMGSVRAIKAEEVGLVLESAQTVFQQELLPRRNHLRLVYVRSLYETVRDLRPMPDGPTAIVVRSPGTGGQLARSVDFYTHVLKDLQAGDFLYVDDSYLPLRLIPAERLGLEEVQVAAAPRLIPQPESVISLGVSLYRKTSSVPTGAIAQACNLDSALYADLELFARDWDSVRFMQTWQGPLAELTSAGRSRLLGRLELLLEASALPAPARQQRREAFRDIFTRRQTSSALFESVAKALMGLLGKVRELSRQGGVDVRAPALEPVLARLTQLRFSLEEVQTHLLLMDRQPDTEAGFLAWVRTQRTLLRHYARLYKVLRQSIVSNPEKANNPRDSSLPDHSA